MNLMQLIKSDYLACNSISRTFFLIVSYRIARYLFLKRNFFVYNVIFKVYRLFYRAFINVICSFDIDYKSDIGPGLVVYHGLCIVIGSNVKIGKNARIRHCTTIGNKGNQDQSSPIIGDFVNIGSNSVIIGNIRIGNNVTIGAGSVVLNDVNDNMTVAGNPAKLIKTVTVHGLAK